MYDTAELADYLAKVRGEGITPSFTNTDMGAQQANTFDVRSPEEVAAAVGSYEVVQAKKVTEAWTDVNSITSMEQARAAEVQVRTSLAEQIGIKDAQYRAEAGLEAAESIVNLSNKMIGSVSVDIANKYNQAKARYEVAKDQDKGTFAKYQIQLDAITSRAAILAQNEKETILANRAISASNRRVQVKENELFNEVSITLGLTPEEIPILESHLGLETGKLTSTHIRTLDPTVHKWIKDNRFGTNIPSANRAVEAGSDVAAFWGSGYENSGVNISKEVKDVILTTVAEWDMKATEAENAITYESMKSEGKMPSDVVFVDTAQPLIEAERRRARTASVEDSKLQHQADYLSFADMVLLPELDPVDAPISSELYDRFTKLTSNKSPWLMTSAELLVTKFRIMHEPIENSTIIPTEPTEPDEYNNIYRDLGFNNAGYVSPGDKVRVWNKMVDKLPKQYNLMYGTTLGTQMGSHTNLIANLRGYR